ncbi:MAG: hypothetical protein D3923_09020 [Candidatus Electrothrix sp. AR3]|nr:hypothetical protein [Candidatus Electrothrix sp. AR3]
MLYICRYFLFMFLFLLFSLPFGVPTRMSLVDRQVSSEASCMVGDKLYNDVVQKLNRRNPQIVLIGSSMLGEAVEQNMLSAMLSKPAAAVWTGGAGSAWWYLVIKNIIPRMKKKPSVIGVFFRDNFLTLPKHRVNGNHKNFIDDFSTEHEELLDRLAYLDQLNIVTLFMQKYLPIFNKKNLYKKKFDRALKNTVAHMYHFDNTKKVNQSIADVFANQNMNDAFLHERQLADDKKHYEYKGQMQFLPKKTFLEPIIRLCHDRGISLVLIRVKRRRDLQAGQQPLKLLTYMAALKKYFKKNGVYLIDYTENQSIKLQHFGRGDHLNRQSGRQLFTSMLAADLKKMPAFQSP